MKVVIVGAGLAGASAAAMLKDRHEVTVYETRKYIGGNCYDCDSTHKVRYHVHGPHIFHTRNEQVWEFLNQYTTFNNYEHKVMADTVLGCIPIPFNDISRDLVGELSESQIRDLLFVDYSEKMWGVPWSLLPEEITSRVPPVRYNNDCRYFTDKYQGIPVPGYTEMFERMFDGCTVQLDAAPDAWEYDPYDLLVYTGSLDEYYEHHYGRLGYKTLDIFPLVDGHIKGSTVAVINQCNKTVKYTRTTDNSFWYSGSDTEDSWDVVTTETPRNAKPDDIPYYPIPYGSNALLGNKYRNLDPGSRTIFIGRLATYTYLNMDQVVEQALTRLAHLT